MVPFNFILAILSIVCFGFAALVILAGKSLPKFSWAERLAVSFGLGCGAVGLEMFFLSIFKVKLGVFSLLVFQLPAYIWAFSLVSRNKGLMAFKFTKPSFSAIEIIFIFVITYNLCSPLLIAGSEQLTIWDSWSHWGYKAKLIFLERGFTPRLFTLDTQAGGVISPHYPLLFPLLEAYIWFFLRAVNEPCVKLLGPLFCIAAHLFFYSACRKTLPRKMALGFTFALSTTQMSNFSTWGYADCPLAFYILCAALYCWNYLKEKEYLYLILSGVFLGIMLWMKNEGIAISAAFAISLGLLMVTKKISLPLKKAILFASIPLIIFLPWVILKVSHNLVIVSYFKYQAKNINNYFVWEAGRLPTLLNYFAAQCVKVEKWNLLWILLGWALFLRARLENRFLLYLIVLSILVYAAVLFRLNVKSEFLPGFMKGVSSRLFLHLVPLIMFFIAQQLWDRFGVYPEREIKP